MPSPDDGHLQTALELARGALTLSNPNPRVGCVLVSPSGETIGAGHTQQAGGPHAEVMALRDAATRGQPTAGATAYVTLEPCSHHGRTPPCCDALLSAGVTRVVIATTDPNPKVAGQGIQRLMAAGVDVVVLPSDSPLSQGSRSLNVGFFSRMIRGLPWVRLKAALSLDGVTALGNGQSQWITGAAARADGHAWRARACAVLTGLGTVRDDDPMLDVREVPATRQPHLVVVDSRLETPVSARLFQPPAHGLPRRVLIYCAHPDAQRRDALERLGATVVCLPNAQGKVDLPSMLQDLAAREINELHLEAGHLLNGSFLREALVDELLLYVAPQLLGSGGKGLSSWGPLQSLNERLNLDIRSVEPVGPDLRILARVQGRDAFLHA